MLKIVVYDHGVRKKLRDLRKTMEGRGAIQDGLKRIGVLALKDIREDFLRKSQPGNREWKRLSSMTIVYRRGPKITTPEDLKAKRSRAMKLRDTGVLFNSLLPGGPRNILEVKRLAVRVGTRDKRATKHQRGGRTSPFQFSEKQLMERVRKTLRPGSPRKDGALTPTGKKSRARRYWNPFFFQLRGAYRKMAGKTAKIPKRRIIEKPTKDRRKRYAAEIQKFISRMLNA